MNKDEGDLWERTSYKRSSLRSLSVKLVNLEDPAYSLPDEIFLYIFSLVDFRSLLAVCQVCVLDLR